MLLIIIITVLIVITIKQAKVVWSLIKFKFEVKYIVGTSFIHYSYFCLVDLVISW